MVRHEAGEALGAIGDPAALSVLEDYCSDPIQEVAETCQLALQRLRWTLDDGDGAPDTQTVYDSIGMDSVRGNR